MVGGRGEMGWILLHDGRRGGFPFCPGVSVTEVGPGDGVRVDSDTKKPDRRAVPHHSKARAWCSDMLGPREPRTRAGDQRVGDCCLDLLRAEGTWFQGCPLNVR